MKLAALIIILLAVFAMPAVADDVDTWIQALKDEDQTVQAFAAEALTKLGWQAPFGQTTAIFDNWNKGSVDNNPTGSTSFIISEPQMITYIDTYHWNYGSGTQSGGTITLRKDDGTKYGPWQVETKPGQGGVPNAWWIAYPNEVIPAGTYTIFDSELETWSKNSESNDCGFSKVEGHTSPSQAPARPVSTIPFDPETGSYKVGSDMVKLPSLDSLIQTSDWGEVPANQVIVMLKEGKGRIDADRLASSLAGQVVGFFEYINLYQIEISGNTETELKEAVAKADQDPDVELAFPNQQAYLDATVQGIQCSPLDDPVYSEGGRGKGYEMIGVQRAWDLIRASGLPLSDVHVGVIDDGLYKGNDEFNGKAKIDTKESDSELNVAENQYGSHGTEVINLIAADPDNGGIAGIASGALKDKLEVSVANRYAPPYGNNPRSAPDPNAPTKVVWTNGKTYTFGSLFAINKTINDGAKIISCSWGSSNGDLDAAAASKKFFEKMANDHPDVIFVCSAGNDGKALDGSHRYPSGLALPNMITVGNIMNDGTNTANSNMVNKMKGAEFEVTLAAPGEESVYGFDNKGGIENSLGGTSMATPQVTSAAALIPRPESPTNGWRDQRDPGGERQDERRCRWQEGARSS
ncbi:MAG: S8 family serine peptidase [Methanothrix sp.]|nr:S8 family serine peptidase [Methanothrix sp.]